MSNSVSVIAIITSKDSSKSFINGTATYRPNNNKYKDFDFKLFDGNNKDIHSFEEGDLVMLSGKFSYRKSHENGNPMFLSVNQAINLSSKENKWNRQTMPVSHPYISASVFLVKDPLQKRGDLDIIKSRCDNVFCTYDKSKHDHEYYLYYDSNISRWEKTTQSIKQGNVRVHISGLYMGYHPKDENASDVFHAIQITELDFESSRFNKTFNDDKDDDDIFFGTSTSKKSSAILQEKREKKHNLTSSASSESSESSSDTSNIKKKKKKKKKYTKKLKETHSMEEDESTKIKQELPYDNLPMKKAVYMLDDDQSVSSKTPPNPYYNHMRPPPQPYPYYPHYSYYPPPPPPSYNFDKNHSTLDNSYNKNFKEKSSVTTVDKSGESNNKDKKIVQFDLQQSDSGEPSKNEKTKKSTRGRGGARARGRGKSPIRKSPRKKGGVLSMAVDKIAEDDVQSEDDARKSESFMDTESDYNAQNDNNEDDENSD